MSWVSTRTYYEEINRVVQSKTNMRHNAPLLIESLDFSSLYRLQDDADWLKAADTLSDAARRLEVAGVGAIIIASNAMHKIYDQVAAAVSIPIFHIAEAVGERMAADGVKVAALFGTRNVMTESFYRRRLVAHGIDLLPPDMSNVALLDRIIFDELRIGKASRDAERALKTMIAVMEQDGAKAIVLACTELDQVVDVSANILPIYDSTRIHAEQAANWILDAA